MTPVHVYHRARAIKPRNWFRMRPVVQRASVSTFKGSRIASAGQLKPDVQTQRDADWLAG